MKLFSVDSPVYKFLSKFLDVVKLNFLWIIFSIPIVTVGASTVAAMSVGLKMVDDEEGYIGKTFLKAFKGVFTDNFTFGISTFPVISVILFTT